MHDTTDASGSGNALIAVIEADGIHTLDAQAADDGETWEVKVERDAGDISHRHTITGVDKIWMDDAPSMSAEPGRVQFRVPHSSAVQVVREDGHVTLGQTKEAETAEERVEALSGKSIETDDVAEL